MKRRKKAKSEGKSIWILKCPALFNNRKVWGDYHFCISLAKAIIKQGQYAEVQLFDDWDDPVDDADVILVLRGRRKYKRVRESKAIHIMWNISHPEDISDKEYNSHDIVFVASNYYANILKKS